APAAAGYAQAVERFLQRAAPGPVPLPSAEDRPATHGEAWPDRNAAPAPGVFTALPPLGTLGGRALACEGSGGSLVGLGLHAARERVLATRLSKAGGGVAPLLGGALDLTPPTQAALLARRQALAEVGLLLEPFGPEALRLVRCPEVLVGHRPEPLLQAALAAL